MDNQLKYVLGGTGISIVLMLIIREVPALAKDSAAWILLICLVAAGIITLIVELYFISRKLYDEMKTGRVQTVPVTDDQP